MSLDKIAIGERLRTFGDQKFGKMSEFARALGMSQGALQSGYLNGRSIPGGEIISKLIEMGCDIYWLFFGDEKDSIPNDVYSNVLPIENVMEYPAGSTRNYLLELHHKYYPIKNRYETQRQIAAKYHPDSITLTNAFEQRLSKIEDDIKDLKAENYDLQKSLSAKEAKIAELEQQNDSLSAENENLRSRVAALLAANAAIDNKMKR